MQFVGKCNQFVVPLLSEAANERFFQKAVYGELQLASLSYGAFADLPSVVVQCDGAVAEAFFADGIEVAADGFGP